MKRFLMLVITVVALAGCIPQFTGNTLTIAVAGEQTAVATFTPDGVVTDFVLFLGDVQRVVSASPELTCSVFETGYQCLADSLSDAVAVTVFADPLELASAQAWWSTPGRPVNIARAALR